VDLIFPSFPVKRELIPSFSALPANDATHGQADGDEFLCPFLSFTIWGKAKEN
jgi:hypothetical protein